MKNSLLLKNILKILLSVHFFQASPSFSAAHSEDQQRVIFKTKKGKEILTTLAIAKKLPLFCAAFSSSEEEENGANVVIEVQYIESATELRKLIHWLESVEQYPEKSVPLTAEMVMFANLMGISENPRIWPHFLALLTPFLLDPHNVLLLERNIGHDLYAEVVNKDPLKAYQFMGAVAKAEQRKKIRKDNHVREIFARDNHPLPLKVALILLKEGFQILHSYILASDEEVEIYYPELSDYRDHLSQSTLIIDFGDKTLIATRPGLWTLHISKFSPRGNNLTRIEPYSLPRHRDLAAIDLSGLKSLTSLGTHFLYGCWGLTSIDLSSLVSLTELEDSFLYDCKGLTSINLNGLTSLTRIGDFFLNGCHGLITINLRALTNLTSVGDGFLHSCRGLTSIDFRGLESLSSVGAWFLGNCSNLISIDLSALTKLTTVNEFFLNKCISLTYLDLPRTSARLPWVKELTKSEEIRITFY